MLPESMRASPPSFGDRPHQRHGYREAKRHTAYQTYVAPGKLYHSRSYPTSASGDLDIVVTEADGSVQHFVQFSRFPSCRLRGSMR
jgi:outer membrane usher protein